MKETVQCAVNLWDLCCHSCLGPPGHETAKGERVDGCLRHQACVMLGNAGPSRGPRVLRSATSSHGDIWRCATLSSGGTVLLGDQNVESVNDSNGSGKAEAFPFVSGASGTAQSITVYITSRQSLKAALYSSKSSRPSSLLASGTLAPPGTGWQTVTIPSTSVTAGATYWIALLGPVNYRDGRNAGCSSYSASFGSFPASFPSGQAWQSCPLSAYVSGTTTPPSNTSLPLISGTPQQRQTLTASSGTWTGNPTNYSYAWSDGAQGPSDTLADAALNTIITVTVTATNGAGSTPATSAGVGPITALPPPQNTAPPTITGTAQQGQTLAATPGTWTNSPTSYTYQWQDCNSSGTGCVNIAGPTPQWTYTITSSDTGYTIAVVVTATNSAGSASQASSSTGIVGGSGSAPANTAAPVISGSAQQGQTLAATTGTWTNSPTSYTYQWQDCNSSGTGCVNIAGPTPQWTYTITSSDTGYTIAVVVTATNSAGSASQASAPTGLVSGTAYAFADEFNGSAVDLTQWDVLNQQGDTSNGEIECYLPTQTTKSAAI